MKATLIILLLACNLVSPNPNIKSTGFTLIDIQSSIVGAILDRLDPGVKKTQAKYLQNRLEIKALEILTKKFESTNDFSLQLDEQIISTISKDFQNLPNPLSIKSAIKKLNKANNRHDAYLQLTTRWYVEDDILGTQKLEPRVKPNLEVILKIFDTNGKQIQKKISRGVIDEFIQIDAFNKSVKSYIDQLVESLQPLLKKTIHRTIDKLETTN